jgi:hypothetical protein
MWADTVDELQEMGKRIGLNGTWIQQARTGQFLHYDLRESKRILAIKNGAIESDLKNWRKNGN